MGEPALGTRAASIERMRKATFALALVLAVAKKRALQARLARRPGERAPLASFAAVAGSGHAMVVFGIALAVAAALTRDRRVRVAARTFAARGAVGWAVFQALRFILAERRPKDGGEMRWFARDGHGVSGHALATALAYGPLMTAFGDEMSPAGRATFSIALRAWIGVVAWSRVRLDEHYVWNVLLGAFIGMRLSAHAPASASSSAASAK
jgi:hypothetical protein